jgi:hypothetical protein
MMETPDTAEHFLDLIKRSRLGKFKVYIGMGTGEGKPIVMSVSRSAAARKKIINDGDARYRRTFFRFDQKIKAGEI